MAWTLKSLERSLLIGSTLVEGSTLSEKEAADVLRGKTVSGHSIHEIRELINYRLAVVWLMQELVRSHFISGDLILHFHQRLFQGMGGNTGQWKSLSNFTFQSDGMRLDYLAPKRVKVAMRDWVAHFNSKNLEMPSHQAAAILYYEFQQIHPFEDGNGRIGRIFIAYWLHWKAKKPFSFYLKDKVEHLVALEAANNGDLIPLFQFFKKRTGSDRKK